MGKITAAFLIFLALLVGSIILPPVWNSALYSCAARGIFCWGILTAIAITGVLFTGMWAVYQLIRVARQADKTAAQPPEKVAFPEGGTLQTGIWLFGILIVYIYFFVMVAVPETIDENNIFLLQILDDRLVVETAVAFLAAGIGAIAATIFSFLDHASTKADWQKQYIPWYILRPFVGSVFGVIFFWLFRGGILAVLPAHNGREFLDLDLNGLAGICALVGMFSRRAMLKLEATFKVIFVVPEDNKTGEADKVSEDVQSGGGSNREGG